MNVRRTIQSPIKHRVEIPGGFAFGAFNGTGNAFKSVIFHNIPLYQKNSI